MGVLTGNLSDYVPLQIEGFSPIWFWFAVIHSMSKFFTTINFDGDVFMMFRRHDCPASQEWQWRHVLFTKLSGT